MIVGDEDVVSSKLANLDMKTRIKAPQEVLLMFDNEEICHEAPWEAVHRSFNEKRGGNCVSSRFFIGSIARWKLSHQTEIAAERITTIEGEFSLLDGGKMV